MKPANRSSKRRGGRGCWLVYYNLVQQNQVLKDVVAINAIAFLNKGNVSGATPAVIEPRESSVVEMWHRITEIPNFGDNRSREKTVAAQPVVLKALAKLTYDLNFNNRRAEDAAEQFRKLLDEVPNIDFSHSNPMWNYYGMSEGERLDSGIETLAEYLPADDGTVANRDVGSKQGQFMRFAAKHNNIFPILADMIRWKVGLPSRRAA